MRIHLISVLWMASSAPAWALNPPVGWTSTGDHTAVRDPRHPEQGEIREFIVGGGTGDPDELEFALRGAGLSPSSISLQMSGSVELVFEDLQAHARFRQDPDQPAWLVLFTGANIETDMDIDAVLVSLLPLPTGVGSGLEQVIPLDAGFDGNPWGDEDPSSSENEGWWAPQDSAAAWSHDGKLVGSWEGTALDRGEPTRMKLRLEGDGMMVLEIRAGDNAQVSEGTWSTRDGSILFELGEEEASLSSYEILGTTLQLRYKGVGFDLVQRR
jgi:hypothetical protein